MISPMISMGNAWPHVQVTSLSKYASLITPFLLRNCLFNFCCLFFKVWDQDDHENWHLRASWKAHSGSVWKVTWAHPEFGQVLATCSFDRTAAIWEEIGTNFIPNHISKYNYSIYKVLSFKQGYVYWRGKGWGICIL